MCSIAEEGGRGRVTMFGKPHKPSVKISVAVFEIPESPTPPPPP